MKTLLYSWITIFFLLPISGFTNINDPEKHSREKKIKKEFKVSANDLLMVNNRYGNIDVTTWDRDLIVIEVLIRTTGKDKEMVQKKLDHIDIDFKQSDGEVNAKTVIERSNTSWWNNLFGDNNNVNMEINYRIKAPSTNNIDLKNDYGNISIDKLKGNASISCDYGSLQIGELLGNKNRLNFDYTRGSNFGYIKRARINADYSEFTIDEAGTLELIADYTDTSILKVENLSLNNDYGSLKIDKVRNLKGQGDYLGVKLERVYGMVHLEMDYGSLKIKKLMPSMKSFDLDIDYTSVKIGYDKEAPFSFDISTSYGGVRGLNATGFTLDKRSKSSGDSYYRGYYLSETSGGKLKIKSSYGSVRFVN
jgi:hypothetical protein